jgi:Helix-turn-helix domain of resolvase
VSDRGGLGFSCDTGKSDSLTCSDRMPGPGPSLVLDLYKRYLLGERKQYQERTALKRETSRANGTRFGRPRKVDESKPIITAKRMKSAGHTSKDVAKYLGVSRATLYRYLDAVGDVSQRDFDPTRAVHWRAVAVAIRTRRATTRCSSIRAASSDH